MSKTMTIVTRCDVCGEEPTAKNPVKTHRLSIDGKERLVEWHDNDCPEAVVRLLNGGRRSDKEPAAHSTEPVAPTDQTCPTCKGKFTARGMALHMTRMHPKGGSKR